MTTFAIGDKVEWDEIKCYQWGRYILSNEALSEALDLTYTNYIQYW